MSSEAFGIKPTNRYSNPNLIPLKTLKINASIKESLATVELSQTFMNLNLSPLECEYSFPIKEECAITSLVIQFSDGTKIKAEIEEESKAQEIYQDSISSGQTAVFAKSELNVITFNIGNIQPYDTISVELKFCFPLQTQLDKWIFTLDNYIFPYTEEGKLGFLEEEIKSNVKGCNYYVDFVLEIFSENSISDFSCEQFQFDILLSENSKHLTAKIKEDAQITPNKSVEISYKTSDANVPKCMIQEHEGEYTAMLSFLPIYQEENEDLEDLEGSGEYLFILDRSGSMYGERIEMAKESLALVLKSLPQRSKFNILSFGTDFICMHPISVEYSQTTLENSLSQLKEFSADLGSTNIYGPLDHIYKTQALNDYPRVIFLITDGDIENPEQVIKIIQENSSTSRVHTFGIGSEVNKDLVKNAAKAGGGISAFINNRSEINQKAIAALQKCIMPALTNWTVNWNDEITPSAERLSTVYYGERFILYSKLGQSLPNSSPILSCFDTKIRARREFTINYSNEISHGEEIRKLWAKNKIEDLEKDENNKAKIIEISTKYQVLSPYTAFIAKHINLNPSTEEIKFTKLKKSEEKDFEPQVSWRAAYTIPNPSIINQISAGYSPNVQMTNLKLMGFSLTSVNQTPINLFNTASSPPPQSQPQNLPPQIFFGSPPISQSHMPGFCPPTLNSPPPPTCASIPMSSSQAHNFQPSSQPIWGYSQGSYSQPPFIPTNQPNPFVSFSPIQMQTQKSISAPPPPPPPSQPIPKLAPPPQSSIRNPPSYSPTSPSYSSTSPSYSPTSPLYQNSQTTPSCSLTSPSYIPIEPTAKKSVSIEKKKEEQKPASSALDLFDIFAEDPVSQKPNEIPARSQKPKMVNYMKLVEIQGFDGSWTNNAIFNLLEFSIEIDEEIRKIFLENLIGTLIALAYLNKYCEGQKVEWGLIERKALRWLKQNHIDRSLIDLMIEKI